MPDPAGRQRRALLAVLSTVVGLTGVVVAYTAAAPRAAATTPETVAIPASGSVPMHLRGNGHGHGMSQYGAQGAALAGLSARQILAFYYPDTHLTRIAPAMIRVLLSGSGRYTRIAAGPAGLAVTGVTGVLPTAGYRYYRLVPDGAGLQLERITTSAGAHWRVVAHNLPARAYFRSSKGYVRLALADGTFTNYLGGVGAVRSGSGELTINRVSLDDYTAGVVPREMPASWLPAAVQAQAVAARTYARNAMASGRGRPYDICDTTNCQVYGGLAHFDANLDVVYRDDPAALRGNTNTVLSYRGAAIFAQFSASNGGATVSGGEPYLPAKVDPYDTTRSGDPYLDQTHSASVAALDNYYGLRRVTSIEITARDGLGAWGGRVVSADVNGVSVDGATARVQTTGESLAAALGLSTTFFHFDRTETAPSAPTSVSVRSRDAGAVVSWRAPADSGFAAVRGYQISYGGHTITVPSSKRSKWVGPLVNGSRPRISVRAVNAAGAGRAVTVSVAPSAAPGAVRPVMAARLFDTRSGPRVDARHPFRFAVPGHGSIPRAGARSVQLAVSIVDPTASGRLRVSTNGVRPIPVAAIAYQRGQLETATVSVPLTPSGTIVFTPSAGSMTLFGDQLSYTAATGSRLRALSPRVVATVPSLRTGGGSSVSLAGVPGVTSATRAVLLRVQGISAQPSYLRVWRSELAAPPNVVDVSVGPGRPGVNTVLVPIGASRRIRVAAGRSGIEGVVSVVGTVQRTGAGRLETFPPSAIADDAAASHPARTLGAAALAVAVRGVAQVPADGVTAVLAQITVRSAGQAGRLWAWARGHARPTAVLAFPAAGSVTTTAIVLLGHDGTIAVQSTRPGVRVSIDAIGYVAG
jgi:SpoIID/LytB domain protein